MQLVVQDKMRYLLTGIFVLMLTCVFAQAKPDILYSAKGYQFQYDLKNADSRIELPGSLEEISGLSYIDKNTLLGVQDEKGNLYFINSKTGKVKRKLKFQKNGDYEGVEKVKNKYWVIDSKGDIYSSDDEGKTKIYKTILNSKNNCEGLGYDPVKDRLLIICKRYPFTKDQKGIINKKSVYSFDLKKKKLDPKPILSIELDSIKSHLKYNAMAKLGLKLISFLNSTKNDLFFRPSGIAVHPKTGHYYILAGGGKLLLVTNSNGKFLALIKLDADDFPQAEGICFSPEGTLFISNEGISEDGYILIFKSKI